jgi:hypothetical protein
MTDEPANPPLASASNDGRLSLIEAIKTPLSFLVLGFLVVDATVAGLAVTLPDFRAPLVWTVIVSVPGFALLVAAMAWFRPEALRGDRPIGQGYGRQFASDLFIALDGSLQNLEPAERVEAWTIVASVIISGRSDTSPYRRFCEEVSSHLKIVANIPARPRGHRPGSNPDASFRQS